jgi:hypothetical protein
MAASIGKSVIKSMNLGFYGPEPIYDRALTGKELADALNWYNYNLAPKDAIGFLVSYLNDIGDKENAKTVKSAGEKFFSFTLGKLARIIQNGATLPDYAYGWINDGLREGNVKYNRSKIEVVTYKAPGKLNENNAAMLDKIETIIENRSDDDVITILEDAKASPKTAQKVIDYLTEEAKKAVTYFTPEEEDDKKEYIETVDGVISDIVVFLNGGDKVEALAKAKVAAPVAPKVRKPRAKKVIPAEKKVEKVQYLKEFPELGLKSIEPKEIIGKSALWYYDVRYQKLVVVRATNGLEVKGTTVIFDEKISESKKIGRKTKETLDFVLKGGKIALKKIFENIKTGNVEVTGRLSENTILLRVEK